MLKKQRRFFQLIGIFSLLTSTAYSLPIDWHGVFGVDTNLIDNYRRIKEIGDRSANGNAGGRGTQEVPLADGAHANASFQSYLFRLNPVLIVNDSASFKGEISSGYGRGGRLGDDSSSAQEAGFGNALYPYNFSGTDSTLILTKFYMELYADTATYQIGRHTDHWALGAVVNSGEGLWDRFAYSRDGITMNINLGNFKISPFWSKVSSANSLTRATKIKEYGFSLLYDNVGQDITFGILFQKKENAAFASEPTVSTQADFPAAETGAFTTTTLGKTDVKLIDIYFKKAFGDLHFGVEVPIFSGEIGSTFGANTKYKAKAIIFESGYKVSDSWKLNFFAGKVSGEDGALDTYDAMYLNPNYQVANLLFRYNLRAVAHPDGTNGRSVYDAYISNAFYTKFGLTYLTEKWTWDAALIWAKAEETASAGSVSYNHTTNKTFSAATTQSDDLGTEVDLGFNYQWNQETSIGGGIGYLFTGDYWAYTNDPTIVNNAENSYILQLRAALEF